MQWKVGDKVRLTGHLWGNKHPNLKRGSQHTVMAVTVLGHVVFEGVIGSWITGGEWEIELVERAEEKKMSIDISEVNKGDRVKLTRENGDEATFTVTHRHTHYLDAVQNMYGVGAGDTLEILEKKFELVPGVYTEHKTCERVTITPDGETYYTAPDGCFIPVPTDDFIVKKAVQGKGYWDLDITF